MNTTQSLSEVSPAVNANFRHKNFVVARPQDDELLGQMLYAAGYAFERCRNDAQRSGWTAAHNPGAWSFNLAEMAEPAKWFAEDYADVEPAENRPDWIGA